MKKGWRLLIFVTGSLVLLSVILTTAVALILSPERLTGLINRYANQYLDATVSLSEASVNVLKNYPNVTITLENGQIIVPSPDPEKAWEDSLLTFNKIEAVIRPLSLIRKRLLIPSLYLENTSIRLFTNTGDRSNWEIFADTSGNTTSAGFTYSIGKLSASDTLHFAYEDLADTVIYRVSIREMTAKSPLTGSALQTDIDSYSNTLIVGKDTLFNRIPFLVKGYITLENNFDDYYFRDCETVLGNVPLYINGFMGLRPDSLELKALCRVDSTGFEDFSDAVPDMILPPNLIKAPDMPLSLEVQLNGAYCYGSGEFPVYSAHLEAGPGSLSYIPLKLVFPSFLAKISSSFDPQKGDEGTLSVHGLDVDSPALKVSLAGTVSSMFRDPSVKVSAKTHFVLDSLGSLLTDLPRHTAKGDVNALLEADCKISDLNFTGLGNLLLKADVSTKGFSLDIPSDSIFCRAGTTRIRAAIDPGKALDADLTTDSLKILYKGRELADISQTVLTAKSTPGMFTRDSTRVQPLEGVLNAKHLAVFINDTVRLGVDQGFLAFTMRADDQDQRIPYIDARLEATRAHGVYGIHSASLSGLNLTAGLTYNQRWLQRRDSLIRTSLRSSDRRRSPRIQHEFSYADLDFDLDRETRGLLRKWDINGILQTSGVTLASPLFPLHTQMHSLKMTLNGNRLEVTDTRIKAGRSDLLLKGYVENIRRVLLGRGILTMNFDLQSDTLDTNELIKALSTESESGSDKLLIVPGNINLQVVLAVSNAYYRHLQMTNLHGLLRTADRYLQLDGLEASSNAG
ncbi:MAG TPA: AsmA family protein, partial [Bacteroidales bacterium]|nr:AsmA family protein [Bacteroidales bacterium]